jgi:hypothetical protein
MNPGSPHKSCLRLTKLSGDYSRRPGGELVKVMSIFRPLLMRVMVGYRSQCLTLLLAWSLKRVLKLDGRCIRSNFVGGRCGGYVVLIIGPRLLEYQAKYRKSPHKSFKIRVFSSNSCCRRRNVMEPDLSWCCTHHFMH